MIIELVSRGEPPDAVRMANTGSERPETEAYIPLFHAWMAVADHDDAIE